MKVYLITAIFLGFGEGARLFLNEPDTGLQDFLGPSFPHGQLPDLKDLWSVPDFDFAARNFLNDTAYTWIRYGTAAELSYQNNLEVYSKISLKPRMLTGQGNLSLE